MSVRLSPTLFALALGAVPCWLYAASAPSDGVRDEHARAIKAAIDIDAKRVAQRQMEEWAKAGYNDGGAPSVKEALQIAFNRRFDPNFKEVALPKDGKLPKIVVELADAGSGMEQLRRLVNEIRRTVNEDGPPPAVKPTDEKLAGLNRAVAKLSAIFEKEFAAASALVEAHKVEEASIPDEETSEGRKKKEAIDNKAINLRLDCMRIFYLAHIVLREVVTRGEEFGIDPKPAVNALGNFTKANREIVAGWDWEYGDMNPWLQFYIAIANGEAVRQQVKGVSVTEAEEAVTKIIELDLSLAPVAAREEVKTLQVKAWAQLLRFELELGTDASRDRGLSLFQKFLEDNKANVGMSLAAPDPDRANAGGQVYLLAGRLNAAKGNSTVSKQLWGQVKAA
jgi:hypothetical protein